MARRVKKGKLVKGLVAETKTAASDMATGYRNKKGCFGGTPKPRGTVKVRRVGSKWGVFDHGK